MEQSQETLVIGVRFSKIGKVYHFESNGITDLKPGDQVVVETSRGWQLGQVAQIVDEPDPPPDGWKPIDRRATPRDLLLRQMWQQKEAEVVNTCKNRANDLNLMGIKIVQAEYSFDGSRLTILFSSETEEKYDLKSLRGDMQKAYAPSQVEMRQIGPRDVAKVHCGMGACGLETRCCCSFLTEFSSISIRMAKEQGISLTPTEITGMCGRLRCCLIYEYDQYVDARKTLPKRNKRVRTPAGEGKVIDVIPLRSMVIVEIPEVGRREFSSAEITLVDGEGGAPVQQAPGAVEEDLQKPVTEPSEIDQVITGNEITPDIVDGVGDSGRPSPTHGPETSRDSQRRGQASQRGGRRDRNTQRGPQEQRPPSQGQQRPQGQNEPRGQQNRRFQDRDRNLAESRGQEQAPPEQRSTDSGTPEGGPQNRRPSGRSRFRPEQRPGQAPNQGQRPAQPDRQQGPRPPRNQGEQGSAPQPDADNQNSPKEQRSGRNFRGNKRRGRRPNDRNNTDNRDNNNNPETGA